MPSQIDLVGPGELATVRTSYVIPVPMNGSGDAFSALYVVRAQAVLLPAVLAGPVVRRSTTTRIHLWICTSTPVAIDASVFLASSPGTPLGKGHAETLPFGDNVHAALIEVEPTGSAFPTGAVLSYTMTFTAMRDRFIGDVAFHPKDITYDGKWPALILPTPQAPAVLLQGSCRKLHADGLDAIGPAEGAMAKVAADPASRPQQMLFTGDQVYADDVHDEVIAFAKRFGPQLLGFDETLPLDTPQGASGIGDRSDLVRKAGFTADKKACTNHAMAFVEYMMLYLLGWSGQFYKFAQTYYSTFVPGGSLSDHGMASAAMQRLLANVPTYMMCDDHEITDDWFIDAPAHRASTTHRLLRRILLNGLANYWLFQAWGNDPEKFSSYGLEISSHIMGHAGTSAGSTFLEDRILKQTWFFVTPDPAGVIMLDTRTRRVLNTLPTPSGLLNTAALGDLAVRLSRAGDGPVIIVSPPPVFGFNGMESLQGALARLTRDEALEYDYETWMANEKWFFSLLETIARSGKKRIVFFAGDVHYSSMASVAYQLKYVDGTPTVEVLHITSSAIKNKMSGLLPPVVLWAGKSWNKDNAKIAGNLDHDSFTSYDSYITKWNPNVFLNWHFHDLGPGTVLSANNIGLFTLQHRTSNDSALLQVRNEFIDENDARYVTVGTWGALMTTVQGNLAPVSDLQFMLEHQPPMLPQL